jgi:uncharacterized membrane protein YeaQ/YmgE (transglycosylase-associated protein family)
MDTLVWLLVGGGVGWVAFSRFNLNEERGRNISIILGAVGAVIGVKAIAPMFLTLPAGGGLSVGVLFFAAAAACAVLVAGNLVSERWNV